MKTTRIIMTLALAVCALVVTGSMRAEDFENPKPGAPKWKVVDYNRVQTHPARVADRIPGGIAFKFLETPDTALLATSHPSYNGNLLGDLTDVNFLHATVGVSVSPGTVFTYYGQGTPSNPCPGDAYVRFYFQTDTSGKFEYTDYWWSNPIHVDLETLKAGDMNLMVPLTPDQWSDWNGQSGASFPNEFNAAKADVQLMGLSFGGGCFFENGVGVEPGTGGGSFHLMDFTATP